MTCSAFFLMDPSSFARPSEDTSSSRALDAGRLVEQASAAGILLFYFLISL